MGDLCVDEELPTTPSTVYHDYEGKTNFVSEHLAFRLSMDDLFVRILNLTSYISQRFIHFIENLVLRDVGRWPQGSAGPSSGEHPRSSFSSNYDFVAEDFPVSSSELSDVGSNHSVDEKTKKKENFPVNRNSQIIENDHSKWGAPSIFKGLMLPLCGLRLAWRLAFACCRRFFFHIRRNQIRFRRFMSRVQKTLHGSSDDIGWLQRTPELPPVEDGTDRFMDVLHEIRNGKHRLPNSLVYLLIPGLFSNHSPLYFVSTKRFFSKMGLACHIAKIHSEAAVEHNAWELKQYIEELYWGAGKRVMLLGHSKGGVDAAAALSLYWSDLKDKVAGLALVQSPYGGTPIASDILREGQIGDKETRKIMELLICKLIKGDMRALEDLTYDKRKEFIMKHKLPQGIPLVSFHSEASVAPGVLATMSHIAHAELPRLSFPTFGDKDLESTQTCCKVPVIVPVAAAMAICALHLKLRYGEKSDGLVTCRDAEVPGSIVIHPDRKLDHAWMVYSSWRKDCREPDASEMCEALLTLLVEIGQMKARTDEAQT